MSNSWLTLADAKAFCRLTGTDDDTQFGEVLDAACAAIEDIKGSIGTFTVTDEATIVENRGVLFTGAHPVASITTVTYLPGDGSTVVIPPADPVNGLAGWELRSLGGVIVIPTSGANGAPVGGNVRLTYQAGRTNIPPNYALAAKWLTQHFWRNSQLNAGAGRPGLGSGDTEWIRGASGESYALPFKVRELLGIYGGKVVRSGVVAR